MAEVLRPGVDFQASPYKPTKHLRTLAWSAAGAMVVGGVVENHRRAVNAWGRWPETALTVLPFEGEQTGVSGVVIQGFGKVEGGAIAEQMKGAIPNIPWASFDYNNVKGLTTADLAAGLTRYKEETNAQYLDAYAPSMGLPTLLIAAKAANIPLRYIFANSSPFELGDGKANGLGKIVQKTPYHFGYAGKMIGTVVTRRKQQGGLKLNHFAEAWRERGQSSPQLLSSQVALLENPAFQDPESFKGIIDPKVTKVFYFSPNPEKDSVVFVEQAFPKWREFFGELGVELQSIPMPEADHASHKHAVKVGKPVFESLYRPKNGTVFPGQLV